MIMSGYPVIAGKLTVQACIPYTHNLYTCNILCVHYEHVCVCVCERVGVHSCSDKDFVCAESWLILKDICYTQLPSSQGRAHTQL